jgi:hypothetical protein
MGVPLMDGPLQAQPHGFRRIPMRTFIAMAAVVGLFLVAGSTRAEEPKVTKIAVDDLPEAVIDAAKTQLPKGEVQSAVEREENGRKIYELTVKTGDKEEMVRVTPKGEIVQQANKPVPTVATGTNQDEPQRRRGLLRRLRERRGRR